jgi:hypothetical protein
VRRQLHHLRLPADAVRRHRPSIRRLLRPADSGCARGRGGGCRLAWLLFSGTLSCSGRRRWPTNGFPLAPNSLSLFPVQKALRVGWRCHTTT